MMRSLAVRLTMLLGLMLSTFLPVLALPVEAAQPTSDVAIVTTENGASVYDACYVLVGYSDVGCDDNGDGKITFQDIPLGTWTVRQTADLGSGRWVSDFTIDVVGAVGSNGWETFYATVNWDSGSTSGQTSLIAILTTENGQPAFDACYVLVDYSEIGCDDNGDGKVTFADIPWGTYTVRQVADLGPGRSVPDFTIQVRGNVNSAGYEAFATTIVNTGGGSSAPGQLVDISLITRDPDTGGLLTDTCYVLVGYSNEGCDDNGDGQVTFEDIPVGTWTVHQTRVPAGYPAISDFDIDVPETDYPTGFVVRQASQPYASGTRNVSVMLIDTATNTKMPTDAACVQIVDVSNVGCDQDLVDGQIDFLDVLAGNHDIVVTRLPAGYSVANPGDLSIRIDASSDPANLFVYLYLQRGGA